MSNLEKSKDISIETSLFGKLSNGEEVKKYILKNRNGFEVSLLSFGATVQSIIVKDKNSKPVNVVLGLDSLEEYLDPKYNRHFGGVVGRTSNRIANSQFTLDGITYNLDKNNGENSLHGGKSGFDMRNWESEVFENGVKFTIFSPDTEGGYPGNVNVNVIYKIDENFNSISIQYQAKTDKRTPIDLTNHAYFNLNGKDSNTPIYNHELKINSDFYLASNSADLIVTGDLKTVNETKNDFRNYTKLEERIVANGPWPSTGYDLFFVSNQASGKKYVASVKNPSNGLKLDVWSDQNGVQFYSGNFLNVTKTNGDSYNLHSGLCLETHNFPDAVNHPNFPSPYLLPEGTYRQETIWKFSVDSLL